MESIMSDCNIEDWAVALKWLTLLEKLEVITPTELRHFQALAWNTLQTTWAQ